MRIPTRTRKAISPVLATVILIAITLIAAIAVAGFVFGLFGTFTSSANIAASPAICKVNGSGNMTVGCTLTLTNSGTAKGSVLATGAAITFAGTKTAGSCTAVTVTPGVASSTNCKFTTTSVIAVSGEAFVGSIATSNGGTVQFAGSF